MPRRPASRGRTDRRGVAALEFALLAPVLTTVALSLHDASHATVVLWQLASAAHAIDLIATSLAATPSLTNVLTQTQAGTAGSAVYAAVPGLSGPPAVSFAVTLSSVVFSASPAGCAGAACTYTAHVAWSATVQGSGPARPCGTLSPAPDGSTPSATTLAADAFSSAPILLVDVTYQFTPLLTTPFAAAFTLREAAYLAPRTGGDSAWVRYSGGNAAQVQCPGYVG